MIKDQPNHTNQIKEPQSSHCLVVHQDDHISYKWYKVKNFVSKAIPRYISTSIHKHTHYFCIFQKKNIEKNLKQSIKTNKQTMHQKLDWLKPQHQPCIDQESERITWNLFPSRWETWMENLSFTWTFVQMDKEESWIHWSKKVTWQP